MDNQNLVELISKLSQVALSLPTKTEKQTQISSAQPPAEKQQHTAPSFATAIENKQKNTQTLQNKPKRQPSTQAIVKMIVEHNRLAQSIRQKPQ